jgi:hypothetical protein
MRSKAVARTAGRRHNRDGARRINYRALIRLTRSGCIRVTFWLLGLSLRRGNRRGKIGGRLDRDYVALLGSQNVLDDHSSLPGSFAAQRSLYGGGVRRPATI